MALLPPWCLPDCRHWPLPTTVVKRLLSQMHRGKKRYYYATSRTKSTVYAGYIDESHIPER